MRKLNDMVDNRVAANLDAIQSTLLVELPADRCGAAAARVPQTHGCALRLPRLLLLCCTAPLGAAHAASLMHHASVCARRSFTYEEFIGAQAKVQRRVADELAVRNEELAAAVEDVIALVQVRARAPASAHARACARHACRLRLSRARLITCLAPAAVAAACVHALPASLPVPHCPSCQAAPRENSEAAVDAGELELFRSYYSSLTYKVGARGA